MKYEPKDKGFLLTPENEQELQILCAIISKWVHAAWPPEIPPDGGFPKSVETPNEEGDDWKVTV